VRRGVDWQASFYQLMKQSAAQNCSFESVLRNLFRQTQRLEASFASKLVATIKPDSPVIDAFVLNHAGLRLPTKSHPDRIKAACEVYESLCEQTSEFLRSATGGHMIAMFRLKYPWAGISEIKMLDLILWQSRS
jgi:hypothetical protein